MIQTTESVDLNLNKLARDMDASIQSCSLELFRTKLNDVLKLQNDIAYTEADLEEKLKTYEAQLNKEKQKLMDVKTNIKDLEADAIKVSEENNHVNNLLLVKLNRKQDMETKIAMLSSIKMNSNDERKIKNASYYYKMYKHFTNVRWSFTESSGTELLSGYVFNRKRQLDWFSVPYNSSKNEEVIEKMWFLISKAADWNQVTI